jgi:hypothetical protein
MIHFERVPEPADFDEKTRQRGMDWLERHPDAARPRDYWSRFRPDLADGFNHLCGYVAMWLQNGTVDHYISVKNNPRLVYEWSNYRYASGWINSAKRNLDDQVMDPFEVQDGWFEIILPSLELVVSEGIPPEHRERAELTLTKLKLRTHPNVMGQRQEYYNAYKSRELSLERLRI